MHMKTDIEIANEVTMKSIIEIAEKLGISNDNLECYGKYKVKITKTQSSDKKGKLILVTSTNPTPYGEGKTTVTIGLNDALCKLGKNSIATLREPSLGPVFGIKGGATGGGYAQAIPMADINLHFTGDIHAITACNNLLCAIIDNHIYQGNLLHIDPDTIQVKRCLDICDRALRHITLQNREESFMITTATEIMAILCLSKNIDDLKEKLSHILVAYDEIGKPLFVSDLKCEDALTILLKDAVYPNLVQSLEHNPILIHGGPFANIAHGCNSVIATNLALSLADYVVTEAGFGSDLGALKFIDIKCRKANLKPDLVIINTTVRALKHNGNGNLEKGIFNLQAHIDIMRKMNTNLLICVNLFEADTKEEIDYIKNYVEAQNIPFTTCDAYHLGSEGATSFAKKVIDLCELENQVTLPYRLEDSIENKIERILKNFYQADTVIIEKEITEKIKKLEQLGFGELPICIAKTQYSISDNPKLLGYPKHTNIRVTDIKVSSGAGFLIIYLGNIMTMPGMPKDPACLHMQIDSNSNIKGLF